MFNYRVDKLTEAIKLYYKEGYFSACEFLHILDNLDLYLEEFTMFDIIEILYNIDKEGK